MQSSIDHNKRLRPNWAVDPAQKKQNVSNFRSFPFLKKIVTTLQQIEQSTCSNLDAELYSLFEQYFCPEPLEENEISSREGTDMTDFEEVRKEVLRNVMDCVSTRNKQAKSAFYKSLVSFIIRAIIAPSRHYLESVLNELFRLVSAAIHLHCERNEWKKPMQAQLSLYIKYAQQFSRALFSSLCIILVGLDVIANVLEENKGPKTQLLEQLSQHSMISPQFLRGRISQIFAYIVRILTEIPSPLIDPRFGTLFYLNYELIHWNDIRADDANFTEAVRKVKSMLSCKGLMLNPINIYHLCLHMDVSILQKYAPKFLIKHDMFVDYYCDRNCQITPTAFPNFIKLNQRCRLRARFMRRLFESYQNSYCGFASYLLLADIISKQADFLDNTPFIEEFVMVIMYNNLSLASCVRIVISALNDITSESAIKVLQFLTKWFGRDAVVEQCLFLLSLHQFTANVFTDVFNENSHHLHDLRYQLLMEGHTTISNNANLPLSTPSDDNSDATGFVCEGLAILNDRLRLDVICYLLFELKVDFSSVYIVMSYTDYVLASINGINNISDSNIQEIIKSGNFESFVVQLENQLIDINRGKPLASLTCDKIALYHLVDSTHTSSHVLVNKSSDNVKYISSELNKKFTAIGLSFTEREKNVNKEPSGEFEQLFESLFFSDNGKMSSDDLLTVDLSRKLTKAREALKAFVTLMKNENFELTVTQNALSCLYRCYIRVYCSTSSPDLTVLDDVSAAETFLFLLILSETQFKTVDNDLSSRPTDVISRKYLQELVLALFGSFELYVGYAYNLLKANDNIPRVEALLSRVRSCQKKTANSDNTFIINETRTLLLSSPIVFFTMMIDNCRFCDSSWANLLVDRLNLSDYSAKCLISLFSFNLKKISLKPLTQGNENLLNVLSTFIRKLFIQCDWLTIDPIIQAIMFAMKSPESSKTCYLNIFVSLLKETSGGSFLNIFDLTKNQLNVIELGSVLATTVFHGEETAHKFYVSPITDQKRKLFDALMRDDNYLDLIYLIIAVWLNRYDAIALNDQASSCDNSDNTRDCYQLLVGSLVLLLDFISMFKPSKDQILPPNKFQKLFSVVPMWVISRLMNWMYPCKFVASQQDQILASNSAPRASHQARINAFLTLNAPEADSAVMLLLSSRYSPRFIHDTSQLYDSYIANCSYDQLRQDLKLERDSLQEQQVLVNEFFAKTLSNISLNFDWLFLNVFWPKIISNEQDSIACAGLLRLVYLNCNKSLASSVVLDKVPSIIDYSVKILDHICVNLFSAMKDEVSSILCFIITYFEILNELLVSTLDVDASDSLLTLSNGNKFSKRHRALLLVFFESRIVKMLNVASKLDSSSQKNMITVCNYLNHIIPATSTVLPSLVSIFRNYITLNPVNKVAATAFIRHCKTNALTYPACDLFERISTGSITDIIMLIENETSSIDFIRHSDKSSLGLINAPTTTADSAYDNSVSTLSSAEVTDNGISHNLSSSSSFTSDVALTSAHSSLAMREAAAAAKEATECNSYNTCLYREDDLSTSSYDNKLSVNRFDDATNDGDNNSKYSDYRHKSATSGSSTSVHQSSRPKSREGSVNNDFIDSRSSNMSSSRNKFEYGALDDMVEQYEKQKFSRQYSSRDYNSSNYKNRRNYN